VQRRRRFVRHAGASFLPGRAQGGFDNFINDLSQLPESGTALDSLCPAMPAKRPSPAALSETPVLRMQRNGPKAGLKTMKIVMAIIKPFKLDEVRDALTSIGVQGLTVTEVKGYGRQKGHTEIYRGAEYAVSFLPKIKVEVAVPSSQADKVIAAIAGAAKTGQIGDGKIFVFNLENAVRIRTGETADAAL
jgi:nitrogen regulatory protein P-II 2